MGAVFACNAYVDAQAPWALRKTDPDQDGCSPRHPRLAVRKLAAAVSPVIPAAAEKIVGTSTPGKAASRSTSRNRCSRASSSAEDEEAA